MFLCHQVEIISRFPHERHRDLCLAETLHLAETGNIQEGSLTLTWPDRSLTLICFPYSTWNLNYCTVLVSQSCPVLCDPTNWGLPGSSVHEIVQARILERVAITFSTLHSSPHFF